MECTFFKGLALSFHQFDLTSPTYNYMIMRWFWLVSGLVGWLAGWLVDSASTNLIQEKNENCVHVIN